MRFLHVAYLALETPCPDLCSRSLVTSGYGLGQEGRWEGAFSITYTEMIAIPQELCIYHDIPGHGHLLISMDFNEFHVLESQQQSQRWKSFRPVIGGAHSVQLSEVRT